MKLICSYWIFSPKRCRLVRTSNKSTTAHLDNIPIKKNIMKDKRKKGWLSGKRRSIIEKEEDEEVVEESQLPLDIPVYQMEEGSIHRLPGGDASEKRYTYVSSIPVTEEGGVEPKQLSFVYVRTPQKVDDEKRLYFVRN